MPSDPRSLKPGDLVLLLNSTPLGEVIDLAELRHHRQRAGLKVGDGNRVDLIKYTAWLVGQRHKEAGDRNKLDLGDVAAGGASAANVGRGKATLTPRQEATIAALMTEGSHRAAARKAGVPESTFYRWLKEPAFRSAYRQARKELVESAVGRLQAATGQAVDTLVAVARRGRRDGDRVRAAAIVLDQSIKAVHEADLLHGDDGPATSTAATGTKELVQMLANRLQQVDRADLPTAEKVRLTATLADTLLRAIGVDVLDARLEALQAVLGGRKEALR